MATKYSIKDDFPTNRFVDLPTREIALLMRDESTTLERADLKAIILELCQRVTDLKDGGGYAN